MSSPVDHEWLLAVLESHQRLIQKVCWAYARSPEEREDLFQEVVVRLLAAARGYDPSRKLSTWLYRVTLNVAIDAARKRRRRAREQPGLDADRQPAPAADPVLGDQLEHLRALLDRQTEVDRALLLLHLEGHSHREIGEVLGLSESNVGTRFSRLKKSLRESVQSSELTPREGDACNSKNSSASGKS